MSFPRNLLRSLFVNQVRLRRQGRRLRLELAPPGPRPQPPLPGGPMRHDLAALLDGCPSSRAVLVHLAVLENLLATRTDAFFLQIPPASLQAMLRQLRGVAGAQPAAGVARLLLELHDAIERQDFAERSLPGAHVMSSFFVDYKLMVKEVNGLDLDDFATTVPLPVLVPSAARAA